MNANNVSHKIKSIRKTDIHLYSLHGKPSRHMLKKSTLTCSHFRTTVSLNARLDNSSFVSVIIYTFLAHKSYHRHDLVT